MHNHHDSTHNHNSFSTHSHVSHIAKDKRSLLIAICSTGSIFIAQIVGAWYSHSLALFSDAGHMFADIGALLIAFIALKMYENSRVAGNNLAKFTFGFKRIEVIAALVNGVILLSICVFLLYEAAERFFQPQEVLTEAMMIAASIGFLANAISAFFLHKSHHLSTRSAYLHVLTDMLSSVAVLIGGAVMYWTKIQWIDPALSALIALFIFRSGYALVRSAGVVLMNASPEKMSKNKIEKDLQDIVGIAEVHDLHVWEVSVDDTSLSVHIVSDNSRVHDEMLVEIHTMLKTNHNIHHATIQIESIDFSKINNCGTCSLTERTDK